MSLLLLLAPAGNAAPGITLVEVTESECPNDHTCYTNSDYGGVDKNNYNIDAVIETQFPEALPAISSAVAKMQNVITGDTDNIESDRMIGVCPKICEKPWPAVIDDIHICFQDDFIDGPGGIIAVASTFCSWTNGASTGTVINGGIQFDENDVQKYIDDGVFDNVVGHELLVSIVMLTLMFS